MIRRHLDEAVVSEVVEETAAATPEPEAEPEIVSEPALPAEPAQPRTETPVEAAPEPEEPEIVRTTAVVEPPIHTEIETPASAEPAPEPAADPAPEEVPGQMEEGHETVIIAPQPDTSMEAVTVGPQPAEATIPDPEEAQPESPVPDVLTDETSDRLPDADASESLIPVDEQLVTQAEDGSEDGSLEQAVALPEAPFVEAAESAQDFDEEVMETFEALAELAAASGSDEKNLEEQEAGILTEDDVVALRTETAPPAPEETFEEHVAVLQASDEAVPAIDTVAEQAATGQPLEESLAQLALSLAETSETEAAEEAVSERLTAVSHALEEVAALLPEEEAAEQEGQQEAVEITPELTQKLLTLLRAVGYDNPREVLVRSVEQHGLEYLLGAVRYLQQLSRDSRHEWLRTRLKTSAATAAASLPARLGRSVLALLARPVAWQTGV